MKFSESSISCEDQSLYRALRKFEYLKMIESTAGKGNKGPVRKYYRMTDLGKKSSTNLQTETSNFSTIKS
jgi:PadR family transcriptional regulator PadR